MSFGKVKQNIPAKSESGHKRKIFTASLNIIEMVNVSFLNAKTTFKIGFRNVAYAPTKTISSTKKKKKTKWKLH